MLNTLKNVLFSYGGKEKTAGSRWRKLWHLGGGSFFPVLAFFVPQWFLLAAIGFLTVIMIAWETARLISPGVNRWSVKWFGILFKKEEVVRPTGTTFMLIASLVVFTCFEKHVAITALLFVSLGDPVASLVGGRYGRHAWRGKTLEGSLACLMVCLVIGSLIALLGRDVPLPVALGGAVVATVFELLPIPLDDNLTVPIISAGAMTLMALV